MLDSSNITLSLTIDMIKRKRFILAVFFLVLPGLLAVASVTKASVADKSKQRRNYLYALEAVRVGNYERYRKYYRQLKDYPLQGYVQYYYLKKRLDKTPAKEVQKYLQHNRHSYNGYLLRLDWLKYLARRGRWKAFVQEYGDGEDLKKSREITCYYLKYKLRHSENKVAVMEQIDKVWLYGKRLPSACDTVFNSWRRAGHMTSDMVWQRIELAMKRRRLSLVRDLSKYLGAKDKLWVERWIAMHKNPVKELAGIRYAVDSQRARNIVRYGVVRIGYRDPEVAMAKWIKLKKKYNFFGEDDNYVNRWLGILGAQNHLPVSLDWLSAVSADADDKRLLIWRVKAAIYLQDWDRVKQFISALPVVIRQEGKWRYWQARALEQTKKKKEAHQIFSEIATNRSYYGFLAADRLKSEYNMQHDNIEATPEEVSAVLALPGIQIAQELYYSGQIVPARRQWNWYLRRLDNRKLQVAALIAQQWGWYDRALYTANKSDHLDDLDIRFPLAYREQIVSNAKRANIDTNWMYGIIRQESAFMKDVRSSAGALGLMQLMPRTGRAESKRLKLNVRSHSEILEVKNNLRLGASHLHTVLGRHGGNQMLATAAYNAGSHRVKRWQPEKKMDADIWTESIPYTETRNYVKNVMAFTTIYMYRLGKNIMRLQSRMQAVEGKDSRK